jgi:hypothetical protein
MTGKLNSQRIVNIDQCNSWLMMRARLITGDSIYIDGGYHVVD